MSLSFSDLGERKDRPMYGPIHNPIQWRIDKPITTQALNSGLIALGLLLILSIIPFPEIGDATRVFYVIIHEVSHCLTAFGCTDALTLDGTQGSHAPIGVQDPAHLAFVAAAGPILPVATAALFLWLGITRRLNGLVLFLVGVVSVWVGFLAISPPGTTFSSVLVGMMICLWAVLPIYPTFRSAGVLLVSGILILETYKNRAYLFHETGGNDTTPSDLALLVQNAGFGSEQSWSAGMISIAIGSLIIAAICIFNWAEQRRGL